MDEKFARGATSAIWAVPPYPLVSYAYDMPLPAMEWLDSKWVNSAHIIISLSIMFVLQKQCLIWFTSCGPASVFTCMVYN